MPSSDWLKVAEVDKCSTLRRLFQLKSRSVSSAYLCGPQFHCQPSGQVLGRDRTNDRTEAYLSDEAWQMIFSSLCPHLRLLGLHARLEEAALARRCSDHAAKLCQRPVGVVPSVQRHDIG